MQQTDTVSSKQVLSRPLEIKADGMTGVFEGYGAIFGNKDRDGDIVARGAFAASLKAGMPALLWQHDQKAPIGRFDEVREDEKGLYVKGQLVMHGRGQEAYELLKIGALNGLSIGFVTKDASRDPATRTRTITEADLMEISLVTFPANELARVSTVKTAFSRGEETTKCDAPTQNARSFERMLRENGFSRTRAKAITAKGFKAANFGNHDTEEIAEMVATLKAKQEVLHEKGRPPVGNFELQAFLSRWSGWQRIGVHGTAQKDYKLTASFSLKSNFATPFRAELEYVGKSGKKLARTNGPGSISVIIPGNGWQEPRIRVGANGTSGIHVKCIVTTMPI